MYSTTKVEQEKTHMREILGARYSNKRNTLEIYSE